MAAVSQAGHDVRPYNTEVDVFSLFDHVTHGQQTLSPTLISDGGQGFKKVAEAHLTL